MRTTQIFIALATVFLAQSVMAQGMGMGVGQQPGDVNVINVPGVTVENSPSVIVENTPGVTVENDSSSPVPVGIVSSVGVSENEQVALTTSGAPTLPGCSFNATGFVRILPDGTRATASFVVPEGKNLIIKDLFWLAVPTPAAAFFVGFTVRATLSSRTPSVGGPQQIFRSKPVDVTSTVNGLGGADHIHGGLRVGSGKELCGGALSRPNGIGHTMFEGDIYGYLVDE